MRADVPHGLRRVGRYSLLALVSAVVLFPIWAVLMQAFKSGPDALNHPESLLPTNLTLDTVRAAWTEGELGRALFNSVVVAVVVTICVMLVSLLSAFAFSFLQFPGKGVVFVAFVATMLVPAEVTVVVNRRTVESWGWLNSYQGLIIPSLASTFGMLLLRQMFLQLPKELREAASLDGVGNMRFLWEVAAPLSRPTLGALGLFTFLGTWNAYLWPSQIIKDRDHRTIQIALEGLSGAQINRFNLVTGGLVIASLPIFAMLVVFQRQLVRGLTAGAVKG
ncbi:MAG TPA: glycerol-3-phosphate ABC transporter permease [Acidimicrobiaceae bacterium]|nr:glycerol-3-phosphate ABC transporter permease [Acidimicrobiaceae bacterium]